MFLVYHMENAFYRMQISALVTEMFKFEKCVKYANEMTDDSVFDHFPKISDHFPKIFEDFLKLLRKPDKCSWTFSEDFQKFLKISEDCWRLSRKTQRCFNNTPTNLSTIWVKSLISVKSSMSSLKRIWKICHSSPGCSFVWILRVCIFQ